MQSGIRRLVGSVAVFSVFTNILMLTGPLFMLQVYDRVLAARSEETLVALLMLVIFLYILYGTLEFARARVMSRVAARFQDSLSAAVFDRLIERAALKTGVPPGRLQDLDAVRGFLASPVFLSLMDMPWTPFFLAGIFIFHPLLGWLALAGGGIMVVIALLNQVTTRRRVDDSSQRLAESQTFARQAEAAAELLWAQGMRGQVRDRWLRMQGSAVDDNARATDLTGGFTAFTRAFRLFLQSAMLALGAWLVLRGEMTGGAMVASSIMLGRALAPVESAVGQWATVQRARNGWRDIRTLLARMPDRPDPIRLPAPRGRLVVNTVSALARPGEPPVLNQVSFTVEPGEALGIIGKSGSGKTTLARVIMGLVAPAFGDVRLDGATLDQFGDRLGGHVGYLPQEVRLLDGTVAENIAQMTENADPAKVVEAARKARVHDIILKLPKGYDTRIAAADALLSGGQRQRLALARALFGNPALLVLDEPNSALDADGSEALNQAVLEMKAAGKSILIMTHRPTALGSCDKLLILDAGRVMAHGPRDEVIRATMKNAEQIQRMVKEKSA